MKVIGVSGSPRINGTVNSIIEKFLEKFTEKKYSCELVLLNRMELHGCQACGFCRNGGQSCNIDDDISKLLEKIGAAEVVIIGSPVYMGNVSGQMKIFIDRLYSLKDSERKPRLAPKRGILVFSQGASGKDHYKEMFLGVKKTLESYNILIDDIVVSDTSSPLKDMEVMDKIESICSRF